MNICPNNPEEQKKTLTSILKTYPDTKDGEGLIEEDGAFHF